MISNLTNAATIINFSGSKIIKNVDQSVIGLAADKMRMVSPGVSSLQPKLACFCIVSNDCFK